MARSKARHARPTSPSRKRKVVAAVVGTAMAGGTAFAVTNWVVGLGAGSSGQGQAATISNLVISAVATPSPANLLYPGANGDVVLQIANPNPYPVTVTALGVPTTASVADGYSDGALTTLVTGCSSTTPSAVTWNSSYAGTSHTLSQAVTVPAASGATSGTLTVTLTNGSTMGSSSPAACAGAYFKLPSLTGVTATGGAATATTGPVTVS